MPSTVSILQGKDLIRPPKWLEDNIMYETIMGSFAYGVSSDTSDCDIYGFCIPPKSLVFAHLEGQIEGFGRQRQRFDQFLADHVDDKSSGKMYDLSIFSIVKFFQLSMDNNPNVIDSLFTPVNCVVHVTKVGNMVRDQRRMFLHKGAWHRFKGYAFQQLHKMGTKNPEAGSKRQKIREQFGFDVKFAYHVVRLLDECEQILQEGDIDLQRAREHMKAIRNGEVPEADIRAWFAEKDKYLEKVYSESKLQYAPDEDKIKSLLLACLEEHYGTLDKCIVVENAATTALREIAAIVERSRAFI
jgi:predicted nucleotidyltransferase